MASHADKMSPAEVPFAPLLAGLAIWSILKIIGQAIVRYFNPEFFEQLKLDIRKKYDFYFVTWMGIIFKLVALWTCSVALLTVSPETDITGLTRPFNTAEQWCWGCRAVIYVQELPDVVSVPELVIHHLLSLTAMISILIYDMPRRQVYIIWATLVSELITGARRLMRMHGKLTPNMSWWFGLAMAMTVMGFRVTGCVVAMVWTLESGAHVNPVAHTANVGALSIYMAYMLKMSWGELRHVKILLVDWTQPAHLVIAKKWRVNLFGIAMSIGLVCTEISAILVYEARGDRLSSEQELQSLAWSALQAAFAGLMGAYVTAPIQRLSVTRSDIPEQKKQPLKMCLQGGFFCAAATLLVTPTMPDSVDKLAFLVCLILSCPLLGAIGYTGCYVAGVRFAKTEQQFASNRFASLISPGMYRKGSQNMEKPTFEHVEMKEDVPPLPPPPTSRLSLPIIASLVSTLLYIELLAFHFSGLADLQHIACIALALEGFIRYEIMKRRGDVVLTAIRLPLVGRVAPMKMWVGAQMIGAWAYLEYVSMDTPAYLMAVNALLAVNSYLIICAMRVLSRPSLRKAGSAFASEKGMGAFAGKPRRMHTGKIAVVIAAVFLCLLLGAGSYFGAMPEPMTSVEQARVALKPPSALRNAASSWQFVVSTTGVAVLPVVVVSVMH